MSSEDSLSRTYSSQQVILINEQLLKVNFLEQHEVKEIDKFITYLKEKYNIIMALQDFHCFFNKLKSSPKQEKQTNSFVRHQTNEIITPFFKQFAQPLKAEEPKRQNKHEKIKYVCKSKRKIKPTDLNTSKNIEELVQYLDNNTNDCHILFERKSRKNNTQKDSIGILHDQCQWAFNEHFYSSLDRGFLKQEEMFKKVIEELKLNPQGMTYYDYKNIKLALPKPKLFNAEFISNETDRLNEYRNEVRSSPKMRSKGEDLSVGRQVIAVHPVCGHLHSGSILAIYKQNQYMVKFTKAELGTQKILDTNITLKEVNHPHKIIIENINFQAMALTIKLLQYKAELIKVLSKYNEIAETQKKGKEGTASLSNAFFQQYGWIGSTINILTFGIRHILSKFRIRGLNQANQQKIGKNFAEVLLNPLTLMEKELEKSSQNSDLNASHQIKKILCGHKDSRVDQFTNELFSRHLNSMKETSWNQYQRQQYEAMIKGLVGILISMKIQHKSFSLQDNKYLKEIMNSFDSRYPELFNQVFELLTSITSKLNEEIK